MNTNNDKVSWLAGILSGWGIKECWAKVLAGALAGALAAVGLLPLSGCTFEATQTAEGAATYRGELSPACIIKVLDGEKK